MRVANEAVLALEDGSRGSSDISDGSKAHKKQLGMYGAYSAEICAMSRQFAAENRITTDCKKALGKPNNESTVRVMCTPYLKV